MSKDIDKRDDQTESETALTDPRPHPERSSHGEDVELGQWYWVKDVDCEENETQWFGCVVKMGSNFVELEAPQYDRSTHSARIHFADIADVLTQENQPAVVIENKIAHYKQQVVQYMEEVKAITARLGVSQQGKLAHPQDTGTHSQATPTLRRTSRP